jgi:hypothetical protein
MRRSRRLRAGVRRSALRAGADALEKKTRRVPRSISSARLGDQTSRPRTDDIGTALAERLRAAIAESRALVVRSDRLLAARSLLAEPPAMVTRCAWCGRVKLRSLWMFPDELPVFLPRPRPSSTTHGICANCLVELRASGRSR